MNAVGYLRLSTKDQSKSLEYQESIIRDYCKRNKLNVLDIFQDNGQSSYNFDRPDYLALEQFIKKHKGKCQYLIVLDHDRFSRNLPEALLKIEELERKYNVIVLSTNERIDLDTSDPDVFMKRAFDYLIANRELLTIRNRTRLGIRNARENGRYLGKAPFGYDNIKERANVNTIRINNEKAFIIEKIFNDFLLGIPPYLIHQHVKILGFKNTGNSAIKHVLSNCTYAGLIKVPAYKTQQEKYVKAMHEPIISEKKYWNIQKILKAKTPRNTRTVVDIPLRGILKCWCGKNLSAGWSKGRSKYYLYYNCTIHRGLNIPGNTIQGKLEKLLNNIFLQPHQIELLKELIRNYSAKQLKQYEENYIDTKKAIKRIDKQISQINEKLINDQMDYLVYKKWTKKYIVDKRNLESNISRQTKYKIEIANESEIFLTGKINMFKIYAACTLSQSQYLLLSIFKNTLSWENDCLSTSFFNPFLASNLPRILSKNLLTIKASNHS